MAQFILDQQWYDRLVNLTGQTGETFERLMPPVSEVERLRQEFERSNYKNNPDLTARHLKTEPIEHVLQELLRLKDDIQTQEQNSHVRQAYLDRIDELTENHRMLLASTAQDMPAFIAANRAIYGDPNPEVFGAVCQWIRREAADAPEVLAVIPDITGDANSLVTSPDAFQKVKELHRSYYAQLFGKSGLPTQAVIDRKTGDEICNRILQNVGSDYALGEATNGLWAVLPSKKQIMRPLGYQLDREAFIGIVSHEIGSHLLETINGDKQPLRLLTSALAGMDGFELSNEGRAFLREQIVYESTAQYTRQPSWQYRITIHLTISLAVGLHDHPYTFSEVYQVLLTLYRFWNGIDAEDEKLAHDAAWHMAVRALKGTNGSGDAYRKDIVYLEGNVKCWELAKTTPELIMLGDLGKYDITNPRHIATLQELKIIP